MLGSRLRLPQSVLVTRRTAAVLFVIGGCDEAVPHARTAPIVTPRGAAIL